MNFIQEKLTVTKKEYLTPHYIRIHLTGKGVPLFENTTVGINNKIFLPSPENNEIYFHNTNEKDKKTSKEHQKSIMRTYTHRGIDLKRNEIWIDFVAHGEEGPASYWAMNAQKGDHLGVSMRNGKAELYPQVAWYLLVGDATAIPVLSAILEDLPATAQGICILEVYSQEDIQIIQTKANIEFIWLTNDCPQKGSNLANIVRAQTLSDTNRFAYVAAEFSSVKEIRHYLRKEQQWTNNELYAYSYWKSGIAEDQSVTDRQNEKKSI